MSSLPLSLCLRCRTWMRRDPKKPTCVCGNTVRDGFYFQLPLIEEES